MKLLTKLTALLCVATLMIPGMAMAEDGIVLHTPFGLRYGSTLGECLDALQQVVDMDKCEVIERESYAEVSAMINLDVSQRAEIFGLPFYSINLRFHADEGGLFFISVNVLYLQSTQVRSYTSATRETSDFPVSFAQMYDKAWTQFKLLEENLTREYGEPTRAGIMTHEEFIENPTEAEIVAAIDKIPPRDTLILGCSAYWRYLQRRDNVWLEIFVGKEIQPNDEVSSSGVIVSITYYDEP